MRKLLLLFPLLLLFIFTSCEDNGTNPPPDPVSKGVYILSEGLFGQNNSSLSFYDPETEEVTNDVYRNANGGTSLGDNGNSMTIIGNKGYIAVNGSNKIEIINTETFVSEGFVDLGAGSSPREIWVKDSTAAYASSFSGNVFKFNPTTKSIEKTINAGDNPEGLAYAAGKVFVANSWFGDTSNISRTVTVIDAASDAVTGTISVGINPTKVFTGPDGKIYVISTGSYVNMDIFSGVYIIDPNSNTVLDSIKVPLNPFEGCFVNENRMLILNADGVMDVNLSNKTVSSSPLIPVSKVTTFQFGQIYSIGYNSERQEILCGNPKDYQQNGEVVIFDLNGTEKKRINVGINPGTIVIN